VLLARAARAIALRAQRAADDPGPIELTVLGTAFTITAGQRQVLELLVSNFEELVRSNAALRDARAEAEAARRKAEDANKAKSDFLAMMSHDLRTPLNAIGGYSELLAMGVRGELNEAQQRDLSRIRRNQQHLLSLVNDVLSFAKIEQGDIPLRIERARLTEVVKPLGAMIEPQTMAKHLQYRFETDDPDVFVTVDRERLEQIVVNLLGNATKFTPEGGRIVMRCGQRDGSGFVSIEDNGIGIPAAKLATIFDPFVQVDQSNTGKREGVGLGLAISKKLALLMRGDLSVVSEPGKGSRFTLTLPLAD
jgi:signal transduction histidine kinase